MRILDCKEKTCKKLNEGAPIILDYLCDECKTHFENVKNALSELNIDYTVDSSIVRGLDYYTKTVFEFISKEEGFTVLAGGRYDGLVEELGGSKTPAIGFALGVERFVEICEKSNENIIKPKQMLLYVANLGEKANLYASKLIRELRVQNIYCEKDITGKSLKAQLKYADKKLSKFVLILGDDEITSNKAKLKEMETGKELEISLDLNEIINIINN